MNARGIIVGNEGKLFAVKHRDRDTNGKSHYWAIPGGGIDVGKSLQTGMKREFVKEIGIKPVSGRLLFIQRFLFTYRTSKFQKNSNFSFTSITVLNFKNQSIFRLRHMVLNSPELNLLILNKMTCYRIFCKPPIPRSLLIKITQLYILIISKKKVANLLA